MNAKRLRDELDEVRTLPEQMKNASEEAIQYFWQGYVEYLRMYLICAPSRLGAAD